MKYLKGREFPVMSRMIVAIGLALGLLSLFQNCSKVNFAADSKSLVQGAVTTTTTPSTSTTTTVSASPPPNVGICVLTCAAEPLDEHEFSQNASCKAPPTCQLEEDGSGTPVKSVVQTISNADSLPKTVCVSKQACQMIASNLSSGKLVLMKTTNNKVSTLKGTTFEPVASADDCQDVLTDDEVAAQFESST